MGASGLGPRKALFDRWLLGFKILQEEMKMKMKMNHISIARIAQARGSCDQKSSLVDKEIPSEKSWCKIFPRGGPKEPNSN